MNTFSATSTSGRTSGSCAMTRTPRRRAAAGPAKVVGAPSRSSSPSSGTRSPDRILISVDLPAPFSPRRACTSPGRSSSDTDRSACTPENALLMRQAGPVLGRLDQRVDGQPADLAAVDEQRGLVARVEPGLPVLAGQVGPEAHADDVGGLDARVL